MAVVGTCEFGTIVSMSKFNSNRKIFVTNFLVFLTGWNYCKVCILDQHLFDTFHLQNGIKEGDGLTSLLFNFALVCSVRRILEDKVGLNGRH